MSNRHEVYVLGECYIEDKPNQNFGLPGGDVLEDAVLDALPMDLLRRIKHQHIITPIITTSKAAPTPPTIATNFYLLGFSSSTS